MAKRTATATRITAPGTAAPKARPTTPPSTSCAAGRCATSSRRCCCRRARRCCSPATSSRARSAATTTPIARTTRSRGSTGRSPETNHAQVRFVQSLTALRRRYPILRRNRFLSTKVNEAIGVKEVTWVSSAGAEMREEDWNNGSRCVGMLLDGRAQATGIKQRGQDATMLLIGNAHHDVVPFTLPGGRRRPGARALVAAARHAVRRARACGRERLFGRRRLCRHGSLDVAVQAEAAAGGAALERAAMTSFDASRRRRGAAAARGVP